MKYPTCIKLYGFLALTFFLEASAKQPAPAEDLTIQLKNKIDLTSPMSDGVETGKKYQACFLDNREQTETPGPARAYCCIYVLASSIPNISILEQPRALTISGLIQTIPNGATNSSKWRGNTSQFTAANKKKITNYVSPIMIRNSSFGGEVLSQLIGTLECKIPDGLPVAKSGVEAVQASFGHHAVITAVQNNPLQSPNVNTEIKKQNVGNKGGFRNAEGNPRLTPPQTGAVKVKEIK